MKNIVIANNKGGTGKTALTLNLIPLINPMAIVDADLHCGISNILQLASDKREIIQVKSKLEITQLMTDKKGLIIDCGGFDSDITRTAMELADIIITPSNDDPQEQFALMKLNEILKAVSKKLGKKVISHIVISRVHPSRRDFKEFEELVSSLSNLELLPVSIPYSAQIPKAAFGGSAVKSGTVAAKFSKLAELLLKQ